KLFPRMKPRQAIKSPRSDPAHRAARHEFLLLKDNRNVRSLALGRPTPVGKKKAGTPVRSPRPLAYSRAAGARVALLRSPILPTARQTVASGGRGVQRRIIRGGKRSNGRNESVCTEDISLVAKMRTFLLLPDIRLPLPLDEAPSVLSAMWHTPGPRQPLPGPPIQPVVMSSFP